jgi:GNAT superfamily N-acetyltransferase
MTRVRVRLLTVDDWELARAIRIEALTESPGAFGSTTEREAALSDEAWRERLAGAWFVAFAAPGDADTGDAARDDDDRGDAAAPERPQGPEIPAGIASVIQDRDDPGARELVGMWAAPAYRGAGVGGALVRACADWARADGAERMTLWAVERNEAALALYARHGFSPTGRTTPLPLRPEVTAAEFVLTV